MVETAVPTRPSEAAGVGVRDCEPVPVAEGLLGAEGETEKEGCAEAAGEGLGGRVAAAGSRSATAAWDYCHAIENFHK